MHLPLTGGGPCPSCGHCPHCGRGGHYFQPWQPICGPLYGGGINTPIPMGGQHSLGGAIGDNTQASFTSQMQQAQWSAAQSSEISAQQNALNPVQGLGGSYGGTK